MTRTTEVGTRTTEVGATTRDRSGSDPKRGSPFASIRFRLLAVFIALLAGATLISVFVVRQILLDRLDERINRELVQETDEVRALAKGNDPETGEPFAGRVRRIFETFLERNIPSRNEAIITFVDGRPYLRSRPVVPFRLDQDAELVTRWGSLSRSERGVVDTPAGAVEFLAVPIRAGRETKGVFVVALFRDLEREETETAIAGAGATGLIILVAGSLLAWRLADRILTPVREVSRTAHSISETDLSRRIEIGGSDEISELAKTFNDMLDRIENAFSAQKHFIDDASHELRTPITIIRGHLETLDVDLEERSKTVALLLDELARMSRLVEDLLLLARSEHPDLLDLNVVDVASLTSQVHAKAGGLAHREWVLEEVGSGLVVADPQRITQALVQLAQNAGNHTAEGDLIAIGSSVRNGEVRFWVRDTGPGIPREQQGRIFERFARGPGGRRSSQGAGLGLAIVRTIAQAHHGRVELDSALGQGATFRMVIPVDQPEDEQEARA
ncbi:MAG: ATP-binding protein [Actinomycetota bacterium]|nr:ATP-binding protein [Actinomycetota bacterium]